MKRIRMISLKTIGLASSLLLLIHGKAFAQGNGTYHHFDIEVDGLTREYTLYVPQGHDSNEEWPVVFHLHGWTLSINALITITQLYLVADTAKFLIVYPQGLNAEWNYPCPDYSHLQNDVAFISRIIGDLNANPDFAIDLDRIHVSGWSMGGEMSFYLACALADRIASVAGISAQMPQQALRTHDTWEPSRPISVLHLQGTNDEFYPEKGDEFCLPLKGVTEFWSEVNGCNAIPDSTAIDDINKDDSTTVTLFNYGSCDDGFEVLLYRIEGGIHEWPGGNFDESYRVNRDINASAEIWNFFKRNHRPSNAMIVEIPDTAFLFALIDEGVDTNGDSLVSYAEAEAIESLNVRGKHISDMTGIKAFVNLDTLRCGMNEFISLDVSGNSALKYLTCNGAPHYINIPLETLNVSDNTQLEFLECMGSNLSNLVLTNNISLKYLEIYRTPLTSLDITDCDSMRTLKCKGTQITDLFVSDKPALRYLDCEGNQLTSLDVSKNTALTSLNCGWNQLSNLDISKNTALTSLICEGNQLSTLDVSKNTGLTILDLGETELTNLDLSNNTSLKQLSIRGIESLGQVCVWTTPFPPEGVTVDTTDSPNVYFAKCTPPKAWEQMESMDIERGGMRSCVLDDMIYVFGGEPASVYASLDSSDAYNTKTNKWSDLAAMPLDLWDPNTEVVNDKIYLVCGMHNAGGENWITTNSIMEYDPEGDSWQVKTDGPETMNANASCVLNDTIFILGGYCDSYPSHQKKAWYYAPGTETWDSLPNMIYNRGIGSSADTLDNKLYVIGGIDDYTNINGKSEVYDPKLKTWTVLADMPVPVINHISVVHDQKILVFGGDSSWSMSIGQWGKSIGTNFIQEYDPSTDSWRLMEGMPFKRANMTGEKVGDYVYIIGGYLNSRDLDQPLAEIWRFNLDSLKVWEDICTEVQLSGYPDSLHVDDTIALYARVLPDYTPDKSVTWSSDNQAVATVSDSGVVICKSAGTVTITATSNAGGCTDSHVVNVVNVPSGIKKTTEQYLSIYPNPVNTVLNIETVTSDPIDIEITSLNGQLLYHNKMGGTTRQLDLSSFQKGVYFITIRSKDFVTTRKIIKL